MGTRDKDTLCTAPSRELAPCPICGSQPLVMLTDPEDEQKEYKCFCSGHGTHVGRGDWKKTQQLAEEDWECRVRDGTQPGLLTATNFDVVRNILVNYIDAETLADLIVGDNFGEYFDIPAYSTKEELLAWFNDTHKAKMLLKFIGLDTYGSRPVYRDANGVLWKDTEPRQGRQPNLCSVLGNCFDGEPDIPMKRMKAYRNVEIVFEPRRITWGDKEESGDGQQ